MDYKLTYLTILSCFYIWFFSFQENYLGEDQKFTDLYEVFTAAEKVSNFTNISATEAKEKPFDARQYRPLEVKVQLTLHDIQAHLLRVRIIWLSTRYAIKYNF